MSRRAHSAKHVPAAHVSTGRRRRSQLMEAGLCVQCAKPVLQGHVYCAKHLEKMRESNRILSRRRAAAGLCGRCDAPAPGGDRLCPSHRALERRYARRKRARRRREGLCPICGTTPETGFPYCNAHLTERIRRTTLGLCQHCDHPPLRGRLYCAAYFDEKRRIARNVAATRRRLGRCVRCGKPAGDYSQCDRHRREAALRERERRKRR